jgi:phage FluMu protein Com
MDDKKGKCPHCKKVIEELNIAKITLHDEIWGSPKGHTYTCPSCHIVLSAGFDPDEITAAIQKVVESALRKHLRT